VTDRRLATLCAALGFLQLSARAVEEAQLGRWLDTWKSAFISPSLCRIVAAAINASPRSPSCGRAAPRLTRANGRAQSRATERDFRSRGVHDEQASASSA
jgi:hypothetical protein